MLNKYTDIVKIDCAMCGSSYKEHLVLPFKEKYGTNIKAVICKVCGLIFLNPRWTDESYGKFYEEDYRILLESDIKPEMFYRRQLSHGADILSFCSNFIARGSYVLDIGCATGGVLAPFKKYHDCKVFGIEPNLEQARYCRERLNIDVFNGLLEDADLAENTFDLVILTKTLHHLLHPLDILNLIHRILKPGGKLLLEVQNFPEYAKAVPRPVQADHTYYFTPATLEIMAGKAGFQTIRIKVDTVKSSRQVDRYVWHRGAFFDIHLLLEKSDKPDELPYADYMPIYNELVKSYRKTSSTSKLAGIIRKLTE